MTTTYSTDAALKLRTVLAAPALAAVNASRAGAGDAALTLDDFRVEAQGLVHRRLAARGVASSAINNPDGLADAEAAFALHLLFTAASSRPNLRNPGAVDIYAQNAESWGARAEAEMAAAVPVLNTKPTGASFRWGRC